MMKYEPVNFNEKYRKFNDRWSPRVIAEMNDYQFKLARLDGDFIWHHHAGTDEAFIVLEGTLRIEMRDGAVRLGPGEMYVVPRGVEHRPCTEGGEVKLLLIEPRGVRNTGETGGDRTTPKDGWV